MSNPQTLRPCIVVMSRFDSMRIDQYISRVGHRVAAKTLGVSRATLESARDEGRMQRATRDRILDNLVDALLSEQA